MANNIAESTVTTIPFVVGGQTKDVYTLNVYAFKSAKFIITVVDETANTVSSFETLVSYKKQPSTTPLHTSSTPIGDVIDYSFNVVFTPDESLGKIMLRVTNSSIHDLKVYVGEIERVE